MKGLTRTAQRGPSGDLGGVPFRLRPHLAAQSSSSTTRRISCREVVSMMWISRPLDGEFERLRATACHSMVGERRVSRWSPHCAATRSRPRQAALGSTRSHGGCSPRSARTSAIAGRRDRTRSRMANPLLAQWPTPSVVRRWGEGTTPECRHAAGGGRRAIPRICGRSSGADRSPRHRFGRTAGLATRYRRCWLSTNEGR